MSDGMLSPQDAEILAEKLGRLQVTVPYPDSPEGHLNNVLQGLYLHAGMGGDVALSHVEVLGMIARLETLKMQLKMWRL